MQEPYSREISKSQINSDRWQLFKAGLIFNFTPQDRLGYAVDMLRGYDNARRYIRNGFMQDPLILALSNSKEWKKYGGKITTSSFIYLNFPYRSKVNAIAQFMHVSPHTAWILSDNFEVKYKGYSGSFNFMLRNYDVIFGEGWDDKTVDTHIHTLINLLSKINVHGEEAFWAWYEEEKEKQVQRLKELQRPKPQATSYPGYSSSGSSASRSVTSRRNDDSPSDPYFEHRVLSNNSAMLWNHDTPDTRNSSSSNRDDSCGRDNGSSSWGSSSDTSGSCSDSSSGGGSFD